MNTGLKYTLITIGVLGTGVGLYFLFKPKSKDGDNNKNDDNVFDNLFAPSPTRYVSDSFPLKKDSGGSRVRKLQEYLNTTYGSGLVVDGKFGPKTEAALKSNTSLTQVDETWYNNNVLASGGNNNTNQNVTDDDDDGDGIPNSIDVDSGSSTYFNPNLYSINLNPPAVQDNTYVAQPYIPQYGFDGLNENIEISDNTITNFDETSPSFYASGLFIDDNY